VTDLVVRGGSVVTAEGTGRRDIAVEDGAIVAVDEDVPGGRIEIRADGLIVLPALLDVHLHFNEPGRERWEGAATGSRALAAGGGALFFDMPLNSTPCTIGVDDFDRKRAALEAASVTDFGLWGGLVPGHIGDMAGMAERGVVGFKAFMCDSGLSEFPRADDVALLEGLREAARLRLPVAVHAESEELTRGLARRIEEHDVRAFLASRPAVAELEAIQRVLLFAAEAGAKLHIVHVSTGRGVAAAYEARARGVDVSIETCPHYLSFTDEDLERLGAVAKCAPPLRSPGEQHMLWRELLAGHVDIVASDHSPSEPAMKAGEFRAAWGGIAGVQSTLPVLIEAHLQRGLPLEAIARLTALAPSRRFGLARKGSIAIGNDADLALVEIGPAHPLRASDLQQRHKSSPYIGRSFRGRIRRTLRRGETIWADGSIVATTRGRLVAPSR
jgi:allantoinase